MSIRLSGDAAAVRALLGRGPAPVTAAALRAAWGSVTGRVLAHDPAAGYLAADFASTYGVSAALRSIVALPGLVLFFDLVSAEEVDWAIEGLATRPVWQSREGKVMGLVHAAGPRETTLLTGFDLAGAQSGRDVVLFHTETRLAASALSFDCVGDEGLRFLLAGFAPGNWDVWRNGWLEQSPVRVMAPACTLGFEGKTGSYFLRKL
ncbi:MAG: hypothetical protein SFV54_09840 [Bryobacteraceae bacterium]|nr:hypothetical protein [Bryobacteraceae bacterium]